MRKMITTEDLRELSITFCPELEYIISNNSLESTSTWGKGLQTGKSIEFITLLSILHNAKRLGFSVETPRIFFEEPALFYQRNVIPYHHGAQAGHSNSIRDNIPLDLKFLASLTPKAILKSPDNRTFLLFREGHPVHLIDYATKNRGQFYFERPDIVLCEAQIKNTLAQGVVNFHYISCGKEITGSLKTINQPMLPLITYNNTGVKTEFTAGIVECSVGKNSSNADTQLLSYKKIFNSNATSILVNGKKDITNYYDIQITLDLNNYSPESFTSVLNSGILAFLEKISLTFPEEP